jgi:hypothetical protein
MRIIPRAEWGAKYPNGAGSAPLPAREVWLHHTVTAAKDGPGIIREIEQIGQNRFGSGISYTWLVTPNGDIYEGHSVNRMGTHTGGRNSIARAIALVGNYDVLGMTEKQIDACAWLLRHAHNSNWIRERRLNGGHRDLKATACPGRFAYAQIAEINHRAMFPPGPPFPVKDVDVKNLILAQEYNSPRVWVGDGVFRRHVKDEQELKDLKYWIAKKGGDPTVVQGWRNLPVLGVDVATLMS